VYKLSLVFNKSPKRWLCVYIHESIKFSAVFDTLVDSVSEWVWIDIKFPSQSSFMRISVFIGVQHPVLQALLTMLILLCTFLVLQSVVPNYLFWVTLAYRA